MSKRSVISTKNPYYVERFRYLELKNFCRQYGIWHSASVHLKFLSKNTSWIITKKNEGSEDPVAKAVESAMYYDKLIGIVDKAMEQLEPQIRHFMYLCVTKGYSYDTIRLRYSIPYSRKSFYKEYRKFFYILNKIRDD